MRSGKRKTDKYSRSGSAIRREPVRDSVSASMKPSGDHPAAASDRVKFFTQQGKPLEKDTIPSVSPLPKLASSSSLPQQEPATSGRSYQRFGGSGGGGGTADTGVAGTQSSQEYAEFVAGMHPYPDTSPYPHPLSGGLAGSGGSGGFPPNPAYSQPSAGMSGGKSNSSLHAAIIVLIVFIGLAIGVANFVWVNDKREARLAQARESSAQNMAMLPAAPDAIPDDAANAVNETPSYSDRQSTQQADIANLKPEPEQAQADENYGIPLDGYLTPSLSLPEALERMEREEREERQASMAGSPPSDTRKTVNPQPEEPDNANQLKAANQLEKKIQPEKKRKPRPENQSRKLADADKKERDRLKEIDRVRTQAYSESSKDRVGERKSSSDSSVGPQSERRKSYRSSQVAQRTVTSTEYARCERAGSIIDRERCKWQLCNNKWGKGGCPSFKPERSYIF